MHPPRFPLLILLLLSLSLSLSLRPCHALRDKSTSPRGRIVNDMPLSPPAIDPRSALSAALTTRQVNSTVTPTNNSTNPGIQCSDEAARPCPGIRTHCCPETHVCCSNGCCPLTHPFCVKFNRLCLDALNTTICTDPDTGSTFSGTPCSYGGCCGRLAGFSTCPSEPGSCVDADGHVPCAVTADQLLPGTRCTGSDSQSCCPAPMRCCEEGRCCFDAQNPDDGPAVPVETLFYDTQDIELGGPAPGVSQSVSPRMSGLPVPSSSSSPSAMAMPSASSSPSAMAMPSLSSSPSRLDMPSLSPSATVDPACPSGHSHSASPPLEPPPLPSPSQTTNLLLECFPHSARIALPQAHVPVAHLRPGDRVAHGGSFLFYTHRDADTVATFVRLVSASGGMLTASRGHFVYVCDGVGTRQVVAAGDVRPIRHALCRVEEKGKIVADPVVRVEHVQEKGLYNPQTDSGNIVVDGFLATCYTTATTHMRTGIGKLAAPHALLAPVRAATALFFDTRHGKEQS